MERFQLILLILISSAYFLTCGKPNEGKTTTTAGTNSRDSLDLRESGNSYSPSWLCLHFSGSGTNWLATIAAPELTQEVLMDHDIDLLVKKSEGIDTIRETDAGQIVYAIPEPGKIVVSSDFYPDSLQFRYRVSPITRKNTAMNSLAAIR